MKGTLWVFPYKPSILGYPYFWKHPLVAAIETHKLHESYCRLDSCLSLPTPKPEKKYDYQSPVFNVFAKENDEVNLTQPSWTLK